MRPLAAAIVFGAIACGLVADSPGTAIASHSYPKHYKWTDLMPFGDGRIQYNQCTDGTPAELNWDDGIENWDAALASQEFDPATCTAPGGSRTTLRWDNAGNICAAGDDACWIPQVTDAGSYYYLNGADIYFRKSTYPLATPASQIGLSAHEWGHNLSLDHHDGQTDCTVSSIMGKTATGVCLTGPSGTDLTTVWCAVYRSCYWQGFQNWGPAANVPPGGIAHNHGRPDHTHMVHRSGSDIYWKYWNGSAWDGWHNMSTLISDPMFGGAIGISVGDGEIHLTGISTAGQLWHKRRTSGGSWNFWTNLGSPPEGALNGQVALSNAGGDVYLIAKRNSTLYLRFFRTSTGWSGWENHGGPIDGAIAVAARGGLIHIVGFGSPSPNVYMRYWNGQSWQAPNGGWEWLGCCLDDSLAVDNANAVRYKTPGMAHVGVHVMAFSSQSAYIRCWDSYCLGSGWDYQGGPAYGGPAAVTNQSGEAHMVVISSQTLFHRWRGP